jgi:hypothetical protein
MKTLSTTIKMTGCVICCLAISHIAMAYDNAYVETMLKQIRTVYTSDAIEELQGAVHALERIGDAEKDKWEPFYYASFGYIMMSNKSEEPGQRDRYLDLALAGIQKAKTVNPGESEIVALEGFVHMMRVTVDPKTRGPEYSGLSMQTFGKAIAMNPENPRALGLMAQMQFGTAKFFGSSTAEACGTAGLALQKFETFTSDNPLAPQWGKEMTVALNAQCQ